MNGHIEVLAKASTGLKSVTWTFSELCNLRYSNSPDALNIACGTACFSISNGKLWFKNEQNISFIITIIRKAYLPGYDSCG